MKQAFIDFQKQFAYNPIIENLSLDEELIESVNLSEEFNSEGFCYGCLEEENCYPLGYRNEGEYCLDNKFINQLDAGDVCENSFECSSNICI